MHQPYTNCVLPARRGPPLPVLLLLALRWGLSGARRGAPAAVCVSLKGGGGGEFGLGPDEQAYELL